MALELSMYHNPRCSKSRQTLKLLEEHGHKPTIIDYINEGLTPGQIAELAQSLGCTLHGLLRRKEKAYAEHGLSPQASDADVVAALVASPILLERPVVVSAQGARVGRPPESVLEILS
jgi:arsenate reductase